MMSALIIVGTVIGVAAGWGAKLLWIDWERQYRQRHRGPPPGGETMGYVIVIAAFFTASMLSARLLLWLG